MTYLYESFQVHESRQCSSNYPDKLIPMPMPVDINSGMPMGGLGRKKRADEGTSEGRNPDNGNGITLANSIGECKGLCLKQLDEMKTIEKVTLMRDV